MDSSVVIMGGQGVSGVEEGIRGLSSNGENTIKKKLLKNKINGWLIT